jgi:hypothetical protein
MPFTLPRPAPASALVCMRLSVAGARAGARARPALPPGGAGRPRRAAPHPGAHPPAHRPRGPPPPLAAAATAPAAGIAVATAVAWASALLSAALTVFLLAAIPTLMVGEERRDGRAGRGEQ